MDVLEPVRLYKEDVWDAANYTPHQGQEVIHRSQARHRVASCGRRFGKSVAGGMELVVEALRAQVELGHLIDQGLRREYWIVGPNYSDAEKEFRVLYDTLKALGVDFDRPGTYDNDRAGELQVSLFNGWYVVTGRSAAHENTLVGSGLDGALLVEAAKLKPRVWRKFIRPTLLDRRGWSLHTSTPEGRNDFYQHYLLGQDPAETDWASWQMPSWANDQLFPRRTRGPRDRQGAAGYERRAVRAGDRSGLRHLRRARLRGVR